MGQGVQNKEHLLQATTCLIEKSIMTYYPSEIHAQLVPNYGLVVTEPRMLVAGLS